MECVSPGRDGENWTNSRVERDKERQQQVTRRKEGRKKQDERERKKNECKAGMERKLREKNDK